MTESSSLYGIQPTSQDKAGQRDPSPQDPIVEVITPDVYNNYGADGSRDPFSGIWSRTLRIKIIGRDGFEKLNVKIPVSQLSSMGIGFILLSVYILWIIHSRSFISQLKVTDC